MTPELIAQYHCNTGENPLWHPTEKRLYWTDIPAGKIYRYDPHSGKHELCYSGDVVGGFTVQADGALLLFMSRGMVASWRDGKLTTVVGEMPGETTGRFNDVIADPAGRVFCGYMRFGPNQAGTLYRLDTNRQMTGLLDGIGISNGLAFTVDRKQMYYTDSLARKIYRFDYDEATGNISNQQVFIETPAGEGLPDGMTIDAEGYIWSARWDGSALYRYTPDGQVERRIEFPARKVSSVTFGGDDYSDIYVTTAIGGDNPKTEGAGAGALFRLRLGIKGVPEYYSRVGL